MTRAIHQSPSFPMEPPLTIGVISDTHVPDRARDLHPALIPALLQAKVDLILHAGDLSTSSVVDSLGEIAPIIVCRGNRDLLLSQLPWQENFVLAGIQFSLQHSHGNFRQYLQDKFMYILQGYRFERYQKILLDSVPQARVFVFGHTHRPVNIWHENKLFFNPGSASIPVEGKPHPSFGIIKITPEMEILSEIIPLTGYLMKSRRWERSE